MVKGYHGYKSTQKNSSEDDELRKVQKTHDTHAVAIKKSIVKECHTVEDIPRKSSSVYSIFVRCDGTIYCGGKNFAE